MTWEDWIREEAPALGLTVTSGYRSPQHEAALGGPATSYHSTGTPAQPGAIDVGGPAAQLKVLFDQIKAQFQGRINELYLNLPAGGSEDVKNNQTIGTNPEAGRAQHLHIALSGSVSPYGIDPAMGHVIDPTTGVPFTAGAPHYAASGAGEEGRAAGADCTRSFCIPTGLAIGGDMPQKCFCWSDIWVYGAGVALLAVGGLMLSKGRA